MPSALFILGLAFALLALHALRPMRGPAVMVLGAWFASWLFTELPFHLLGINLALAGGLAVSGGLADGLGLAGLALTALGAIALVRQHALARRTAARVEQALCAGLGDDYSGCLGARAAAERRLLRLARVVPIGHREVERVRDIVFHADGRRPLRLDLYRPRAAGAGRPMFLFVHGGGWVIGNKRQQGLVTLHHLAARGWVCLSIDYRLSPRATFPDHLHDVKRAIGWARRHGAEWGGDPSCLVIAGASAGAHLAALAALTPNALEYQRDFPDVDTSVQGCVAYYGVYDLTNRHGHWPHRGLRMLMEHVVMKRRLADAPVEYDKASPIAQVGPHAPPFLILHGDRDNLAPVAEARRFAAALRAAGAAPVVYAELPGAQHAFELLPSVRSLDAVAGVERFCGWLRARPGARNH